MKLPSIHSFKRWSCVFGPGVRHALLVVLISVALSGLGVPVMAGSDIRADSCGQGKPHPDNPGTSDEIRNRDCDQSLVCATKRSFGKVLIGTAPDVAKAKAPTLPVGFAISPVAPIRLKYFRASPRGPPVQSKSSRMNTVFSLTGNENSANVMSVPGSFPWA